MLLLLEAETQANMMPYNIAVGVLVFLSLAVCMGFVHGVGASRPHS